jgi:hypothetical protein
MNYLQPITGFYVELPEVSSLVGVKGYKIIPGTTPSKYGDIMGDLPLSDTVTLESLSFHDVFHELMKKSKLFLDDKSLVNKNIFFLRKCVLYDTYHWVHVHGWSEKGYCLAENPNANFFVEPWRDASKRKNLLEESILFVMQSKKELVLN